ERAEGKIRSLTLAGAYGDELSLWPESFFRILMTRLSVEGAKFFGTTNPDSPFHWLKKDYLARAGEIDLRHWHSTLPATPNVPRAYVQALENEYTGLWRKRFVLGLWVAAEGAIYDMFDPERHVVDILPTLCEHWVGIDYGTTNPFVALLVGHGDDDRLYVVDEWRWDSAASGRQKTDAEYSRDLRAWLSKHGVRPRWIFYDPSAASFGIQLWRDNVPGVTQADN